MAGALETNDAAVSASALGVVTRAKEMPQVAKKKRSSPENSFIALLAQTAIQHCGRRSR